MTTAVVEALRWMPAGAGTALPDFRDDVPATDLVALAARLLDVDVSAAPSVDLLARAVGWERVVAMAQAVQARVVGELAARAEVGPGRLTDELQAAFSCTAYQVQRLVMRAEGLTAHPALGDALGTGTVDLRRVDAVLDSLPVGGDPHRWDGVVAAVLEDAPRWSPPALRRMTEKLVMAAEPEQAEARCARARDDRGLELRSMGDGMALLTALLPAPAAVNAFTVVDALAGTSRTAGDTRDIHQRRADAFTSIFEAIATTGTLPHGTSLPRKHGRRAEIQVTVAATTLLGLDELPGDLAGYGPIPAGMARAIAQDGTWRRLLTDPAAGTLVERGTATYEPGADLTAFVIARDVTCTFMGCGQPGWRCELDHREPFDPARPADEQTTSDNLDARCKHHHEQKTSGGWSVRRIPGSGASEWTDPWGITFTRLTIPITLTAAALAAIRHRDPGQPRWGCGPSADPAQRATHSSGYPDEPPF
jgi:hypothetical protein